MFKPHYGVCVCHNEKRLIVVKKGYCKQGNDERKGKSTRRMGKSIVQDKDGSSKNNGVVRILKAKRQKPIQYRRKPSGELEVFKKIAERECENSSWRCRCCKEKIQNLTVNNFSHILPKSIAPELRLDERNIWIVCSNCHYSWEFGDRSQQKFDEKRKLFEELKREINNSEL